MKEGNELLEVEQEVEDIHEHDHDHDHGHDHGGTHQSGFRPYLPVIISFTFLISALIIEHLLQATFFTPTIKKGWYLIAYLPVAWPVLKMAWKNILNGQFFTEFFLMSLATIGAFAIGEYPEAVAVMIFYSVGELFQDAAVNRSKNNIRALLDIRPKIAHVLQGKSFTTMHPKEVAVGATIQVKVGEKVPLDGELLSPFASFNTAALTGESKPQQILIGKQVLGGFINLGSVIEVSVKKSYQDSSIARILDLVQNATSKKSKTELLIRRLAKIYTPIVVYLALAICLLPWFFVDDYIFRDWLYRALIFLVISCPCALVISIPLGYFGGLGAASQNGILFKGATYLDQLTKVNTLVLDKTGTLTKGVFEIQDIVILNGMKESDFMMTLQALESKSTHPIAMAIMKYMIDQPIYEATDIQEIAGKGIRGKVDGREVLAGNGKLLHQFNVEVPAEINDIVDATVLLGIDHELAGYVIIADELKGDSKATVDSLIKGGLRELVMLSGDKDSITQKVAKALGIEKAKGDLLPEDKLYELEKIKKDTSKVVAFVGDGINDAPVLAASDVGIAMGGLGSDVAIESADMIIQTDQPSKIVLGIRIAKATQRIIWQNIVFAFAVKALVLVLGSFGMATMWQAVFADVGVALLAILNAVRLQRMKW